MMHSERGFSLIEVCLGLIILGVIMGPLIAQYQVYLHNQAITSTEGNLQTSSDALQKFFTQNGFYPLPADPSLGPADAGYGQGIPFADIGTIVNCGGGDTDVCRTPSVSLPGEFVYIGSVPFATLGMPQKFSVDGYRSKLTYAVSGPLVNVATFNNSTGGAIRIQDRSGVPSQVFDGGNSSQTHYVIISHGEDSIGAFSPDGALKSACAGAGADRENCDNDDIFNNNFFSFPDGSYDRYAQIPAGADHFDDFVSFRTLIGGGMWQVSENTQDIIHNYTNGLVMIGAGVPQAKVDVDGNVRSVSLATIRLCELGSCPAPGAIQAGTITPEYAPGVFNPGIIAGPEAATNPEYAGAGIVCGTERAMRGINNADEICSNQAPPGIVNIGNCATGRAYATDAAGHVLCQASW